MKLFNGKSVLAGFLAGFIVILIIDTIRAHVEVDEYVFYRLIQNLPHYNTSAAWIQHFTPSGYALISKLLGNQYWINGYTLPVWTHPPLGPILAWPLVKAGLTELQLKIVADGLFLLSLVFILQVIRRRLNLALAVLCFFPMTLLNYALQGIPFFYHDAFMVLFLALSFYLVDRKSKWAYVAASALVLTKIDAGLFLLPLALYQRNWKLLLPALAIIPYWAYSWVVTSNPLYLVQHWLSVGGYIPDIWGVIVSTNLMTRFLWSGVWLFVPLLIWAYLKSRQLWILALGVINLLLTGYVITFNQMPQMLLTIPLLMSYIIQPQEQRVEESRELTKIGKGWVKEGVDE